MLFLYAGFMQVYREPFTKDLKKRIFQGFDEHAAEKTGSTDELYDPVVFCIRDAAGDVISAACVKVFWGSLQVKYLWTAKDDRSKGYASKLMEEAFAYGKKNGCKFATVETMSFQAKDFYEKLGFTVDFERKGYAKGTSFIYLQKNLEEE